MATFSDANPTRDMVDRRVSQAGAPGVERRQFGNSHAGLSPEAKELAEAVDDYKLKNSRRYVTFEEILHVIESLGYAKQHVTI